MSSSITTPTTVTGAALLAITTPFVQPPDCTSYWGTTSLRSNVINGTIRMTRVIVSESAASCYPPGWTGDKTTPGKPSFSPGVCPDGWVYWDMAKASSAAASTAFCCDRSVCVSSLVMVWALGQEHSLTVDPSGFSLQWLPLYWPETSLVPESRLCGSWSRNTGAGTETSSEHPASILMVHDPWAVTWAASDTATLTPKLPTLTNSIALPTWTPDQVIPDSAYEPPKENKDGLKISQSLYLFICIGIPLIAAAMVGSCIGCCVQSCRKRRREERALAGNSSTKQSSG